VSAAAKAKRQPATLRVLRYDARKGTLKTVVGARSGARIPRQALKEMARDALARDGFVCHTAEDDREHLGDEVCCVPRGERCEIVSIHTNGWRRQHGDHRRSLVAILAEIAAAVARGSLTFLDDAELATELVRGEAVLTGSVDDTASLSRARQTVALALDKYGLDPETSRRMQLCVSEATTNMLLHGGGGGTMALRVLDDHLRVIIADRGPGLSFINWIEPPDGRIQASMGYGYKIILDTLERVYMHTGSEGTTLILDQTIATGD
jgi:anti-sigma regulatory factor (Ser/Thr protein kinase)